MSGVCLVRTPHISQFPGMASAATLAQSAIRGNPVPEVPVWLEEAS